MKTKKKIISIILAVSIAFSSLAASLSALALTNNEIALNTFITSTFSGADDKIWYTYTPSVSGKYALVCYSQSCEAYLFTKTKNPDGSKTYNQLAYAGPKDDGYLDHFRYFTDSSGKKDETKKHYQSTFYLEVYLIKGTTYYFAAGYEDERVSNKTVSVALYNLSIDESEVLIDSISAKCSTVLSAYTDGWWDTDNNGDTYYYYNYSKIIQNMLIDIAFKDGTTTQISASDKSFDGMNITFEHRQMNDHWYPQNSDEYSKNKLVVKIGPVACEYDVQIETSAMYGAKGKIVDYATGLPIENANIYLNGVLTTKTNSNGVFAFIQPAGNYNITVKTDSSIDYSYLFVVSSSNSSLNNQTSNPVKLINCDYVKDGIINAKDYAFAKKNGYAYHTSITNFTKANY